MRITRLWKRNGSGDGGCPALYRADDGGYVVQGVTLDEATRAQLQEVAGDETAVWVPADVLDRLRDLR
jgi:hypothetical protein